MKEDFGQQCSPIVSDGENDDVSFDFDELDEANLDNDINPTETECKTDENDSSCEEEDITDMVFLTKGHHFNLDKYKQEESMKFGAR